MQLSSTKLVPFIKRIFVDISKSRKDESLKWLYDIFFGNIEAGAGRAFTQEKTEFYEHYFRREGEGIPGFLKNRYYQEIFIESLISIMLKKRKANANHDFRFILPDEEGGFSSPALKNLHLISAQIVTDMQQKFIEGHLNNQTNIDPATLAGEKKLLKQGKLIALEEADNKIHITSGQKLMRDSAFALEKSTSGIKTPKLRPIFYVGEETKGKEKSKEQEKEAETQQTDIEEETENEEPAQKIKTTGKETQEKLPESAEKEVFTLPGEKPEQKEILQDLEVTGVKTESSPDIESKEDSQAVPETEILPSAMETKETFEETGETFEGEKQDSSEEVSPANLLSSIDGTQKILILNQMEDAGFAITDIDQEFELGTAISPQGETVNFSIESDPNLDENPKLYFINPKNPEEKTEINPETLQNYSQQQDEEFSESEAESESSRPARMPIQLPESRILNEQGLSASLNQEQEAEISNEQSVEETFNRENRKISLPAPIESSEEETYSLPEENFGLIKSEYKLPDLNSVGQSENSKSERSSTDQDAASVQVQGSANREVKKSSNRENKQQVQKQRYNETKTPTQGSTASSVKKAPKKDHTGLKILGGGAGGVGGALYWLFGGDSAEAKTAFINLFHNIFT